MYAITFRENLKEWNNIFLIPMLEDIISMLCTISLAMYDNSIWRHGSYENPKLKCQYTHGYTDRNTFQNILDWLVSVILKHPIPNYYINNWRNILEIFSLVWHRKLMNRDIDCNREREMVKMFITHSES